MVLTVLLLAPHGVAWGKRNRGDEKAPPSSHVWINPRLGLKYSQWLVGPTSWMATTEEIVLYLALEDDQAAAHFEEEFWRSRDANASVLFGGVRQTFEERSEEADRRFSEGTRLGRRTDRGAIYILYGDPTSIEYETSAEPNEPTLEVWSYGRGVEPGLDGRPPKQQFLFTRQGDSTGLVSGSLRRSRIKAQRR